MCGGVILRRKMPCFYGESFLLENGSHATVDSVA
jgi:hypothetical protein